MNTAGKEWRELKSAAESLSRRGFTGAKLALVLGSGLGKLADKVLKAKIINTVDIPGYPSSSVEGHQGRILLGELSGVKCLVFQGRVHYYEGYSALKICTPVIVSKFLGIDSLILTNAAGSINSMFKAGSLMLIEDFFCAFHHNPLQGLVEPTIRGGCFTTDDIIFPPYRSIAEEASAAAGIVIHKGVLSVMTGPSYETPAEVRMLQYAGADAASMSTAPEIIMAKYLNMRLLALSCLTNMGAGISVKKLTHKEVQETAVKISTEFEKMMLYCVKKIGCFHGWLKTKHSNPLK